MGKLFGTDGIRGQANQYPVTPEMALRLGKAIAQVFGRRRGAKRRVIIGKDTRLSGYMLESAITSGLISMGMDVYLVGPMPTPAIAHLTRSMIASCGIMITASHNPAQDNGLKIFDASGFKLPDDVENEIEELILSEDPIVPEHPASMGKAYRIDDVAGRYIEYAKNTIDSQSLEGLRVVMDCANGAAYYMSPIIFKELGVDVIKMNTEPDGLNINLNCGALHPEDLGRAVRKFRADCGVAFDGDADRVIFTDAEGVVVDGDRIIAMCALEMHARGELNNNTIAVTSMSNLGLHHAMAKAGIKVEVTDVGDRYVIEAMREGHLSLGGEQSGHIIFSRHATTGDGTLAALKVLALMKRSGRTLADLASCMSICPQKLLSIPVREKRPFDQVPQLLSVLKDCEAALGNNGRVVLRYSGTEKKIRVLVEAVRQADVDRWIEAFRKVILAELGA